MGDSPLVSIHVPKTAGTSFQLVLQQIAGNGLWLDDRAPAEPPDWATCVHGHAPASHRLRQFPDAPLVCWLRHPVDRVLSHYRYWAERPDPNHPLCVRMHELQMSPVEFAEMLPAVQRSMLDVDLARFDFVGIVEQMELSIEVFRRCIGRSRFQMPWVNTSSSGGVTDRLRREIESVCAEEMELYRDGLARLLTALRVEPRETRLDEWSTALTAQSVRR